MLLLVSGMVSWRGALRQPGGLVEKLKLWANAESRFTFLRRASYLCWLLRHICVDRGPGPDGSGGCDRGLGFAYRAVAQGTLRRVSQSHQTQEWSGSEFASDHPARWRAWAGGGSWSPGRK